MNTVQRLLDGVSLRALRLCVKSRAKAQSSQSQALVIGACAVLLFGGCGDNKPVRNDEPPQPEVLDKLDSEDPDKFLEGVDEARDKYGKKT